MYNRELETSPAKMAAHNENQKAAAAARMVKVAAKKRLKKEAK
jgi:hypothetical protein